VYCGTRLDGHGQPNERCEKRERDHRDAQHGWPASKPTANDSNQDTAKHAHDDGSNRH
jgi:hypothetical protein